MGVESPRRQDGEEEEVGGRKAIEGVALLMLHCELSPFIFPHLALSKCSGRSTRAENCFYPSATLHGW